MGLSWNLAGLQPALAPPISQNTPTVQQNPAQHATLMRLMATHLLQTKQVMDMLVMPMLPPQTSLLFLLDLWALYSEAFVGLPHNEALSIRVGLLDTDFEESFEFST